MYGGLNGVDRGHKREVVDLQERVEVMVEKPISQKREA